MILTEQGMLGRDCTNLIALGDLPDRRSSLDAVLEAGVLFKW